MANLYLITRIDTGYGYDEYDSAVVVAESEKEAVRIHPGGRNTNCCWPDKTQIAMGLVEADLLGTAKSSLEVGSVVCASFNAG